MDHFLSTATSSSTSGLGFRLGGGHLRNTGRHREYRFAADLTGCADFPINLNPLMVRNTNARFGGAVLIEPVEL